jgi:hypothetical protein
LNILFIVITIYFSYKRNNEVRANQVVENGIWLSLISLEQEVDLTKLDIYKDYVTLDGALISACLVFSNYTKLHF